MRPLAAAFAGLLLVAKPAFAHGPFPASNEILFSPSDPNLVIARATYGILASRDNGTTWRFLCEDALGLLNTATLDPALGLTATNALVAGVTNDIRQLGGYLGLDVSADLGCNWNCIGGPLAQQAFSDVIVRPDGPDVVLAVSSTYRPVDAGGGADSRVFESIDDGATWTTIGALSDPTVVIQTINVSRSDPSRVYLSGTRGVGAKRTAALFVSMDKALHWTERPLPQFDPGAEEFLWIAGVDPADADRVYMRSSAFINSGGDSRLYVTDDAGKSFQMALDFQVPPLPAGLVKSGIGELLGFALSPDGSKIYAGSKERGLFVAAKSDLTFHQVNSTIAVQCLATRGNELWACSDAKSGFIVGVSADEGAHFCPKMKEITSLSAPMACDTSGAATLGCGATIRGSECKASFDAFCELNSLTGQCQSDDPSSVLAECRGNQSGIEPACPTGTGAEAGTSDGGVVLAPRSSGCGCSTVRSAGTGGLLLLPLVLGVSRKRRSRSTRRDRH